MRRREDGAMVRGERRWQEERKRAIREEGVKIFRSYK